MAAPWIPAGESESKSLLHRQWTKGHMTEAGKRVLSESWSCWNKLMASRIGEGGTCVGYLGVKREKSQPSFGGSGAKS